MEVSAGQYVACLDEQQRVIRDGIGLQAKSDAAIANQIQTGTHHLRLTAEGIRVLHARAVEVRGANGAAGEQVPVLARHGDLPGLSPDFVYALVERRVAALQS